MSQDAEKSKFVTVVAWIFIVGTGFAIFISLEAGVVINSLLLNTWLKLAASSCVVSLPVNWQCDVVTQNNRAEAKANFILNRLVLQIFYWLFNRRYG